MLTISERDWLFYAEKFGRRYVQLSGFCDEQMSYYRKYGQYTQRFRDEGNQE
jgi:hypothetical protein